MALPHGAFGGLLRAIVASPGHTHLLFLAHVNWVLY